MIMMRLYFLSLFLLILIGCATSIDKSNPTAFAVKARAHLQDGEFDQALAYIDEMEKQKIKLTDEAFVIKAVSLQNLDEEQKAQTVLEAGVKQYPSSRKINSQLAASAYQHQKYEMSLSALKKVYPHGTTELAPAKLFIKNYLILKQNGPALEIADKLMDKHIDDVEVRYFRALAAFRMKEFNKSAEDFRFCYHKDFQTDKAAKYLAFIHVNLKNVDKANYYIRHLALKTPDDAFTQKMFLRNLLNINSVDRISTLKVFLTFIEGDWEQYELVKTLYEKDYVNEAIDVLAGLHEEDSSKIWVSLNYAKILVKNGQHEEAVAALKETIGHWSGSEKTMLQGYLVKVEKIKELDYDQKNSTIANMEHEMAPKDNVFEQVSGREVAAKVDSTPSPAPATPVNQYKTDFVEYEVKKGEILIEISNRFYGTPYKWQMLQELNRPLVDDPYKIPIGTIIKVPVSP